MSGVSSAVLNPYLTPVVAGQVAAGLGRGDEVVGADGIASVGEGDLHDAGPLLGKKVDRVQDLALDPRVQPFDKILFGKADPEPRQSLFQGPAKIGSVTSAEVVSSGSWPQIAFKSRAQSSTVRPMAPT